MQNRSQQQKEASQHNYLNFKLGIHRNQISDMLKYKYQTLTEETIEALNQVIKTINSAQDTMKHRRRYNQRDE